MDRATGGDSDAKALVDAVAPLSDTNLVETSAFAGKKRGWRFWGNADWKTCQKNGLKIQHQSYIYIYIHIERASII